MSFIFQIILKFTRNLKNQYPKIKNKMEKLEKREVKRKWIKIQIQIQTQKKKRKNKTKKDKELIQMHQYYQKVLINQLKKRKIKKKIEREAEVNHLNGSPQ